MVDGSEYNVRNMCDSVKDFHKRIIAPYGTNMSFVEILPGVLIGTANIVSIRELTERELVELSKGEEITGLRETEVEVEEAKPVQDFFDGNVMDEKKNKRKQELESKRRLL